MNKTDLLLKRIKDLEKIVASQKVIINALVSYSSAKPVDEDNQSMEYLANCSMPNYIADQRTEKWSQHPEALADVQQSNILASRNPIQKSLDRSGAADVKSKPANHANRKRQTSTDSQMTKKQCLKESSSEEGEVEESIHGYDESEIALNILEVCNHSSTTANIFKGSCRFNQFVTYCVSLNSDYKMESSKFKITTGVKTYITLNLDGIILNIFDNMAKYSLLEVYSTFLVLNKEITPSVKLAMLYNVLLSANPHLLVFYVFPLMANTDFEDTILIETIRKVLNFQLTTDFEFFSDKSVVEFLKHIKKQLKLDVKPEDLNQHLLKCIGNINFKFNEMLNYANEICSICLICLFYDWEYSYNHIVAEILTPMYKTDRPKSLYLLGTMATMGLVMVGRHESVERIMNFIQEHLNSNDTLLASIAYHFLKSVEPEICSIWYKQNESNILTAEIDPEFLNRSPIMF